MIRYISEALGTFFLTFFGTYAIVRTGGETLKVALAFGAAFTVVIYLFARISGAHCNPAISFAAYLRGELSSHYLCPYWIAQFLGAVGASFFLSLFTPATTLLGATTFGQTSVFTVFAIEVACTFLLAFIYLFTLERHSAIIQYVGGFTLFVLIVAVFTITGASFNPARSVGPLVMSPNALPADQIWLYITAPFVGGGVAGVVLRKVLPRRGN